MEALNLLSFYKKNKHIYAINQTRFLAYYSYYF